MRTGALLSSPVSSARPEPFPTWSRFPRVPAHQASPLLRVPRGPMRSPAGQEHRSGLFESSTAPDQHHLNSQGKSLSGSTKGRRMTFHSYPSNSVHEPTRDRDSSLTALNQQAGTSGVLSFQPCGNQKRCAILPTGAESLDAVRYIFHLPIGQVAMQWQHQRALDQMVRGRR